MDQIKIGKCILALRREHGMTQAELASRIGVTAQAVSKWENGRGLPDISLLKRISEEFQIDLSQLLDGTLAPAAKREAAAAAPRRKRRWLIPAVIIAAAAVTAAVLLAGKPDTGYAFSSLSSENREFTIRGVAAYADSQKSIYISDVKSDDSISSHVYASITCGLYESSGSTDVLIAEAESLGGNSTETFADYLRSVTFTVNQNTPGCTVLTESSLYLMIDAEDADGHLDTYRIPITLDAACG